MAALAAVIPFIAAGATIAGTAISAQGTLAAGKSYQQSANYEAKQLDAKGKEEQAAARVEADQYKRKKDLALSSLQARAGAGGFTATDPTALDLAEGIETQGSLQEAMALYGGQSRRTGLEAQARGREFEGAAYKAASKSKAAGTILGGVSTLAGRFNPGATTTSDDSPYRFGRPISDDIDPRTGWRTTTYRNPSYR